MHQAIKDNQSNDASSLELELGGCPQCLFLQWSWSIWSVRFFVSQAAEPLATPQSTKAMLVLNRFSHQLVSLSSAMLQKLASSLYRRLWKQQICTASNLRSSEGTKPGVISGIYSSTCAVPNKEVCCASLALQILCPNYDIQTQITDQSQLCRHTNYTKEPEKSDLQTTEKLRRKKSSCKPTQNIKASHVPETATKTKPNLTCWQFVHQYISTQSLPFFWTPQKRVKNCVFWWGVRRKRCKKINQLTNAGWLPGTYRCLFQLKSIVHYTSLCTETKPTNTAPSFSVNFNKLSPSKTPFWARSRNCMLCKCSWKAEVLACKGKYVSVEAESNWAFPSLASLNSFEIRAHTANIC